MNHCGLDTMYDNTHGNELISIMNALSVLLNDAQSMGADESDCEAIRDAIVTDILTSRDYYKLHYKGPRADIKRKLAENCYTVKLKYGYLDIGYLLSLWF